MKRASRYFSKQKMKETLKNMINESTRKTLQKMRRLIKGCSSNGGSSEHTVFMKVNTNHLLVKLDAVQLMKK